MARTTTREDPKRARLQQLADQPAEQTAYALELLKKETRLDLVTAALDVLAARPNLSFRPALLRAFDRFNRDPIRTDASCLIRIAILRTLRPIAHPEDAPLLERAATTYEVIPFIGEVAGGLRSAGLVVLNEVDERLARYHAVRLLHDERTEPMSGEPALTAARVLASQEQMLPLYAYAATDGSASEVTAECLRNLTGLPASLLPGLIERYLESDDEIVLLGLFDLLLSPPFRAGSRDLIFDFLETTSLLDFYRYLVSTLAASHDDETIALLTTMAGEETNRAKASILREALAVR